MKKHNRLLIIYFLLFGLLSFQSDLVLAQEEKKVYITFIYEKIEEIIDVRGKTDEEIEQIESEIASESCIPYESKSKDYVYKLKPSIITSEKELLEAMGAKSEQFLKYGQKCLLSAYRAATSEKLQLKAEGLEDKDYLEIVLIDTSNDGNDFGNGYDTSKFGLEPDIRNDFWPCSYVYEPKIQLSDVEYKYQKTTFIDLLNLNIKSGKKDIASTVNHEYAHFLDDTIFNQKKYNVENMYGLDGHHRGDEITNQGVAFIEGWAEYNEMIEYSKKVRNYKKYTKSLVEESDSIAGLYFDVAPKDCDFSTLLKSEAYNALLLYRLSQKLGQEKINEAFIKTRDNRYRDLKDLVKKLVELHPEDTETICKVVDRVFYNKASKEELLERGNRGYKILCREQKN